MDNEPSSGPFRLDGRTALITGGANGIGRGVALALARSGANVALADIDSEGLRRTESEIAQLGVGVVADRMDVRDPAEVSGFVEKCHQAMGRIDILACVAGGSLLSGDTAPNALDETDPCYWDEVFALNVRGAFLCARAVTPYLRAQRWGRIIFTSSSSFRNGGLTTSSCAYVAAKSALVGLTRRLAVELTPFGITCNAVAPGPTLSERFRRDWFPNLQQKGFDRLPIGRAAEVDEVAAAYVFLASEQASYISGATLDVSGGGSFG